MAASFELAVVLACVMLLAAACQGALELGYYDKTCPKAEGLVRAQVKKAVRANPGVGAGLIRLLFHDCFVEGCDASVLLDSSPENPQPEKEGAPNINSLRGFEVIDAAKDAVEEACPGTVSCADILAFAARDASYLLSGHSIDFRMPAGRLDGRRSSGPETLHFLPAPTSNLTELVDNFSGKGLDVENMVVLSGAHSVGRARCLFVQGRLAGESSSDDMNPSFRTWLRRRCPPASGTDRTTVRMDRTAAVLDSQYYTDVLDRRVLLSSDAALLTSRDTETMVRDYAAGDGQWERKFEMAMVKMAAIDVKASGDGEIRKNCRSINHY